MSEKFSPNDAFAFFNNLWKQSEPLSNMFPGLSEEELERKIVELKVVENWLQANLNMLSVSIKTLELQKATLAAMRPADKGKGAATKPE